MPGPDKWGPHGWKFIHYITLGYPDKPTNQDKIKYKFFFTSLKDVIPCILCKNNYESHLKIYPLTDYILKSKINLMTWGIKMHNLVNIENNKKKYSIKNGIKLINENDDTCPIRKLSNTSKLDKFINFFPMVIFGIILVYQLAQIYCKKFR